MYRYYMGINNNNYYDVSTTKIPIYYKINMTLINYTLMKVYYFNFYIWIYFEKYCINKICVFLLIDWHLEISERNKVSQSIKYWSGIKLSRMTCKFLQIACKILA